MKAFGVLSPKSQVQPVMLPVEIVVWSVKLTQRIGQPFSVSPTKAGFGSAPVVTGMITVSIQPAVFVTISETL